MFCKYCGGRIDDSAPRTFCPFCGKQLGAAPPAPTADENPAPAQQMYNGAGNVPQQPSFVIGSDPYAQAPFASGAAPADPYAPPAQQDLFGAGAAPADPYAPPAQQDLFGAGAAPADPYAPPATTELFPEAKGKAVKEKGNTGLKIVLIVLIVLLVAGLGVGAYYIIYGDKDDGGGSEKRKKESVSDTSESREEPGSAHGPTDPVYVPDDTTAPDHTTESESQTTTQPSEPPTLDTQEITTTEPPASPSRPITDPSPVNKYKAGKYINSTHSIVNMRSGHSTSTNVINSVGIWETITVTEVYEDTSTNSAYTRWWGKTSKGGKTGWVALFYLTPTDMDNEQFDEQAVKELWQQLDGYWNTLDKKRFASFTTENGKCYFSYGTWYSEVEIAAYTQGGAVGTRNGVIRLHIYSPGSSDYGPGMINTDIYLDLSEVSNGKIAWNFGQNWEDGHFRGKTMDAARPPLSP